jgi:hypothetical protein
MKKGSSVTLCQSLDELKSYRCYLHLPLRFSYYGTGHAIYKGYMFYNQDGTRDLVSYSLDKHESKKINAPDDAACCDMTNSLYNVKHSGYFDFEIDEHGLWLIYKLTNGQITTNGANANTSTSEYRYLEKSTAEREDQVTYVIAKIDETNIADMRIEKKWYVQVNRQNVANMFIACGQLFALSNTVTSPANVYRLCDLVSNGGQGACSSTLSKELSSKLDAETADTSSSFNITISSRQITSLAYNPDKRLLYIVDGGSFAYYKMHIL